VRRWAEGVKKIDELRADQIARVSEDDPERVIALLEPIVNDDRKARLLSVISKRIASISVLVESTHDPHNGAAVLRSCEAFGIHALHVIEMHEAFLAATSVSRGAEKWVEIVSHPGIQESIDGMADFELVATHPEGTLLPDDLRHLSKFSLVIGNEREGISPVLRAACKHTVRVPMRGFVESLNMSVTAAILLASATQGRPGDLPLADQRRMYARGLYFSYGQADKILGYAIE